MRQTAASAVIFCLGVALACGDQGVQPTGGATQLAFTVQSSNTSAGAVITPPIRVAALDALGNTDTVFSGNPVTVAIKSNPGGGALSGTLTAVTVNGVATFSDLRIDKAGSGYSLSAGAAGLFGATSATFYVAGPATQMTFGVQPTNAEANQAITPPVQVAVQDSAGNTVPDFVDTVTVSFATNPGAGSLSGTRTAGASQGVATFPGLAIDLAGSGYTLLASAAGLSAVSSTAFNVACISNCWTVRASMPTPRAWLGVGVLNGVLYTIGGYASGAPPDTGITGKVEAYDPGTNSWTTMAPLAHPREGLAVGVQNGVLYAVGGVQPGGGVTGVVEAYDPTTNTWTTRASMPTARYGLSFEVVSGRLYAMGGAGGGSSAHTVVEEYDPSSDTWVTKAPMPTGRLYFGAAVANGVIYVLGGSGLTSPPTAMEAYDPATNVWTSKPQMPTPRSGVGAAALNGLIYAVGGADSILRTTVERYDPASNTWAAKAPMPTARRALALGVVNGMLYAIGGAKANPILSANEEYRP